MSSISELKKYSGVKVKLNEADGPPDSPDAQLNDTQIMKTGSVSTDKIISKLNSIRSGKSFRDSSIKKSLVDYVDSLKQSEKVALFAFLKGVSQIVTGEVEGKKAVEPADPAPGIEMKKVQFKRVIKPTVIIKSKKGANEPSEDTSAPAPTVAPIKPKK